MTHCFYKTVATQHCTYVLIRFYKAILVDQSFVQLAHFPCFTKLCCCKSLLYNCSHFRYNLFPKCSIILPLHPPLHHQYPTEPGPYTSTSSTRLHTLAHTITLHVRYLSQLALISWTFFFFIKHRKRRLINTLASLAVAPV